MLQSPLHIIQMAIQRFLTRLEVNIVSEEW